MRKEVLGIRIVALFLCINHISCIQTESTLPQESAPREQMAKAGSEPKTPRVQFRLVATQDNTSPAEEFPNPNDWSGKEPTLRVLKEVLLNESHIASAEVRKMHNGSPHLWYELTDSGREIFARVTGDNIGGTLAIILDGELVSAPRILAKISGKEGWIQINKQFPQEKAEAFVSAIDAGNSAP